MKRTKLKEARKQAGLKVKEIARTIGISISHYYKIEEGIRTPTLNLAQKIAKILNKNIEEIFFTEELDILSHKHKKAENI